MKIPNWIERAIVRRIWKGYHVSGFLTKFFSTDSIVSRIVRGILMSILAGGAADSAGGLTLPGGVHLPPIVAYLLGLLAGAIAGGQNNASPASVGGKEKPAPVSAKA